MSEIVDELKKTIETKIEEVQKAAKDHSEGRVGELKKELNSLLEKHEDEIGKFVAKDVETQKQLKALEAGIEKLREEKDPRLANKSMGAIIEKSLKENDAYNAILKGSSARGEVLTKAVGDMTTSSALTGAVIDNPRVPGIFDPILREVHIRQLLAQGSMTGASIEYDVETGSEGGPTYVAEAGSKPQVDYDIEHKSDKAAKIAVFARVSDELFADLPLFSSYITGRMMGDIYRVEDTKLLYGAGSGDIEGITARTGVLDIDTDALTSDWAAPSTGQALLNAFAHMAANNVQVNGALMNPATKYDMLANIESGGADVAFNLVYSGDLLTFNGVPIITSTAVSGDDILVGDWSASNAQMFQREGMRIEFSTEDATNFTTNEITVRVEERVALAVFRPAAFGYASLADIKAAITTA